MQRYNATYFAPTELIGGSNLAPLLALLQSHFCGLSYIYTEFVISLLCFIALHLVSSTIMFPDDAFPQTARCPKPIIMKQLRNYKGRKQGSGR